MYMGMPGVGCWCLHTAKPMHTTPTNSYDSARAVYLSPKIYKIPRARPAWGAMRQFPTARLESRRTVGGQTRGVVGSRVARMWYTNMGVARCYACVTGL